MHVRLLRQLLEAGISSHDLDKDQAQGWKKKREKQLVVTPVPLNLDLRRFEPADFCENVFERSPVRGPIIDAARHLGNPGEGFFINLDREACVNLAEPRIDHGKSGCSPASDPDCINLDTERLGNTRRIQRLDLTAVVYAVSN